MSVGFADDCLRATSDEPPPGVVAEWLVALAAQSAAFFAAVGASLLASLIEKGLELTSLTSRER